MKGIDIFCASQSSRAIYLGMLQDQASSSSSAIHLGGRALDRHNPIIRDTKRLSRALPSASGSSEAPPINPKPYHQLQKPNNTKKTSLSSNKKISTDKKKKSSSSNSKPLTDHTNKNPSCNSNGVAIYKDCYTATPADTKKKSLAPLGDFITPTGSSRYLLSDAAFFDGLSDYDPVLALVPEAEPKKKLAIINGDDSAASKSSSSSRSEQPPSNKVVVLRVSLHCKGCEGKVRKHLSRMKGVTSFNIDFAAKEVTVVGDVTPLSVLASISKVKNAQFWPVPAAATSSVSASVASPRNKLEIKK